VRVRTRPAICTGVYLERSDIFVGVYWQRYGWVAPGETVSELEDEDRLSQCIPRPLYQQQMEVEQVVVGERTCLR
jgi:hypothetical protein